jgi:hypothetical protein
VNLTAVRDNRLVNVEEKARKEFLHAVEPMRSGNIPLEKNAC